MRYRTYYYDHFIYEKIEVKKGLNSFLKVTQLLNWKVGIKIPGSLTPTRCRASLLLLLLLLSRFSHVRLCVTSHRWQPTRFPRPWDSPGKNIGVGCHFLLQCIKVKSESEVPQSCLTLGDPMDCSLPGFSIHGIIQARVLECHCLFRVKSLGVI